MNSFALAHRGTVTGLNVAAPNRPSLGSPCDTSDASRRARSSNFCDRLVLRHGQVPFCRPLDRNWGSRKDHGTYHRAPIRANLCIVLLLLWHHLLNHGGFDQRFDYDQVSQLINEKNDDLYVRMGAGSVIMLFESRFTWSCSVCVCLFFVCLLG